MLDRTTKKRIDDLRDILVGKLPDPKAQIEQITIALIYKFMEDMDKEAIELGGERKFFSGDYEKFSWDNLFDPKVKGEDQLKLYISAIESMEVNPHLPELFRDIFRNAFLPYRDPETLRQFLKIINDFQYDHSEKLGDAFEYLLSVMGSQGDAGQFRTPRHIIDFMVEILDPQKHESILDPACGTSGFLISSYKHIIKHNSSNFSGNHHSEENTAGKRGDEESGNKSKGVKEEVLENPVRYNADKLTADERKKLVENIKGYDISPDMVRMSLVNMYLHGFPDPHIEEYDTLTSEKKWDELADVVMANPPFMSPKGGIRPHQQFSIQSNRSEVLFVDYIAEHLTMNGRAAIIVPEGIIFQSGTAYKNLRKMLVEENFLAGVISLPAGVFNPYSGVKTSILWMDKELAKKTDRILFVKIENDGFDLGAQRKPIKEKDLPEAFEIIKHYESLLLHEDAGIKELEKYAEKLEQGKTALLVEKERIGENGEYNLRGERYRIQSQFISDFPILSLSEVATVIPGQSPPGKYYNETCEGLPFFQGKTEFGEMYLGAPKKWTSKITRESFPRDILMSVRAPVGPVNLNNKHICIGRGLAAIRSGDKINPLYLYHILKSVEAKIAGSGGLVFDNISRKDIEAIQIPLPPLSVQEEIVAEIESYQKIIDGARQVVENYKPRIYIDPDWPMVELGEVCANLDGKRVPITKSDRKAGPYPYYGASGVVDHVDDYLFDEDLLLVSEDGANLVARVTSIAFSISGKSWVNNHAHVLRFKNIFSQKFIEYYLNSISLENFITGSAQPKLNQRALNTIPVPWPDAHTQEKIVSGINTELKLISDNKKLIFIFEQKIKDRIAKVWGEKKEAVPKLYPETEKEVSVAAEE